MKTSPQLLTDILGVLGNMSAKMDAAEAARASAPKPKGDTSVIGKIGAVGVIGSLMGKKGAAAKMAEDVEKLKTAMKGLNILRLNQMIESLKKYDEVSKESSKSKKASGWAAAAKDMGKALIYIAGGIGLFAVVLAASGGVLGVSPVGVLGFIMGSMLALSLSMMIIAGGDIASDKLAGWIGGKSKTFKNAKADKGRNKDAIQNAKDMGIALMFIAGGIMSFGIVLGLAAAVFGVGKAIMVPFAIAGIVAILGLTMVGLATLTAIGDKKGPGKSKDAIQNAKDMGLALMLIAGGVMAFAISMRLVPAILGTPGNAIVGIISVGLMIAAMVGIFALLTYATPFVETGIQTAKGMGIAIMILSAGVFVVALTSKMLVKMFADTDKKKDGSEKSKGGKILGTLGNAAAGLGIFGLFVAGLGGLLWLMGFPLVSGPIALGSLALIGMAFGLIMTAKAIKKVSDTIKDMGGSSGMAGVSENIRLMVNGVMSGVIAGVMGKDQASGTMLGDAKDITLKDVRSFRRVTKIIKLLGKVSGSLSKFAQGLQAFSKVGTIASLRYTEDEDGNLQPVIGENQPIHVTEISQAIADTFGQFIKTLATNTEGMTRKQARALKILGKALTGDQGIISGVSQFASTLKTFSEFGEKGDIWVPPQYEDEKQTKVREGTGKSVPITTIVKNIVEGFGKFVKEISGRSGEFAVGGRVGRQMKTFTEALMGQEGTGKKGGKPGILSGITSFNDVLLLYSEYGAEGKIPKKDKDGNIIPGQEISVETVAKNMVDGITIFTSALNTALAGTDLATQATLIDTKLKSFTAIITQFDILAQSQEGMDKLANSLGLLATNMGLLVNNMSGLSTEKLNSLATITAQHAVATKGVPIAAATTTSASGSTASTGAQPDWDKIADRMGQIIAQKLTGSHNGEFEFHFFDGNSGGKLEIKEK